MGSDVLLQPSTLQADNHKKRTGFGPQQASFGVYVSNAFGGMSGALNVNDICNSFELSRCDKHVPPLQGTEGVSVRSRQLVAEYVCKRYSMVVVQ